MIINNECIRDILLYLEENLKISIIYDKISYSGTTAKTITEKLNYTVEEIVYSLFLLNQCHYIIGDSLDANNTSLSLMRVRSITYEGQMFLQSIKPQPIWDKTKKVISNVGVYTLSFIEKVAHDVAVESSKQFVHEVYNY